MLLIPCKGCGTPSLVIVPISNLVTRQGSAQNLTFTKQMVSSGIGTFDAFPEPIRHSRFTRWPLWAKNTIPYMIPMPHWKQFSHEIICIVIEIWCSSKIFSVSCVYTVLFKGKVWPNFIVFRCPRSYQCWFKLNGKAGISRAGFLNQGNWLSESYFRAFQN